MRTTQQDVHHMIPQREYTNSDAQAGSIHMPNCLKIYHTGIISRNEL